MTKRGFSSPEKAIRDAIRNGERLIGEARVLPLKEGWGFRTTDGRVLLPFWELTWLEYCREYRTA